MRRTHERAGPSEGRHREGQVCAVGPAILPGDSPLAHVHSCHSCISLRSCRPVLASAKLVSGLIRSDYDGEGLENLVTLWFADIAEMVESTRGFQLQMMIQTNDA